MGTQSPVMVGVFGERDTAKTLWVTCPSGLTHRPCVPAPPPCVCRFLGVEEAAVGSWGRALLGVLPGALLGGVPWTPVPRGGGLLREELVGIN